MRSEPLTPEDEHAVTQALARLGLTDPPALAAGLALMRAYPLARGTHLLRTGEHATLAGVLVTGLLREYFLTERGVERTKGIATALQFTGSLADLLSGQPSRASIVAEEPSRVVLAPYAALRALEGRFPAWTSLQRRSVEHLVRYKAEREYQFLCLDAAARYQAFLTQHPDLEGRVSAHDIASYLGITPVHLSRLRARRARARK